MERVKVLMELGRGVCGLHGCCSLSDGSDAVKSVKLGGSTRHLEFGLGPSLYPVSDGRNGLNFLP